MVCWRESKISGCKTRKALYWYNAQRIVLDCSNISLVKSLAAFLQPHFNYKMYFRNNFIVCQQGKKISCPLECLKTLNKSSNNVNSNKVVTTNLTLRHRDDLVVKKEQSYVRPVVFFLRSATTKRLEHGPLCYCCIVKKRNARARFSMPTARTLGQVRFFEFFPDEVVKLPINEGFSSHSRPLSCTIVKIRQMDRYQPKSKRIKFCIAGESLRFVQLD